MNKKKIIIIAGIVILIGCFEVMYFYLRNRKIDNGSNQSTETSVSSSYSYQQNQNASSSQTTNVIGASIITLKNPESQGLVRDAFLGFINNPSSDLRWAEFRDNKKDPVSLDTFSSAMGIKIDEHVRGLLERSSYDVFSCGIINGVKSVGMEIDAKTLANYKGDLYQDKVKFLKDWEKTMLPDLKNILFPEIDFSQKYLEQELVFKDGEYRYSNVELPNNMKSSINYEILGNPILISNSLDCIKKASYYIFTPDN